MQKNVIALFITAAVAIVALIIVGIIFREQLFTFTSFSTDDRTLQLADTPDRIELDAVPSGIPSQTATPVPSPTYSPQDDSIVAINPRPDSIHQQYFFPETILPLKAESFRQELYPESCVTLSKNVYGNWNGRVWHSNIAYPYVIDTTDKVFLKVYTDDGTPVSWFQSTPGILFPPNGSDSAGQTSYYGNVNTKWFTTNQSQYNNAPKGPISPVNEYEILVSDLCANPSNPSNPCVNGNRGNLSLTVWGSVGPTKGSANTKLCIRAEIGK